MSMTHADEPALLRLPPPIQACMPIAVVAGDCFGVAALNEGAEPVDCSIAAVWYERGLCA